MMPFGVFDVEGDSSVLAIGGSLLFDVEGDSSVLAIGGSLLFDVEGDSSLPIWGLTSIQS